MSIIIKLKYYIIVFSLFTTMQALADTHSLPNDNYMGVEANVLSKVFNSDSLNYQSGYGKNVYAENPFIYSIFVGHKIDDRYGVEFGYETQESKDKTSYLRQGDFLPGARTPLGFNEVYGVPQCLIMTTRTATKHIQALLNVNLHTFETKRNTNLWTQVGVSYSQLKASSKFWNDEIPRPPTQQEIDGTVRNFRKWKLIPVVKVGINCECTDNVGIRASANWKGLSRFKLKSIETPNSDSEVRLKNSVSYNLGVYYTF